MGPNKRKLAAQLYHRLREHYAPHGLLHCGQGKWYPGEQLPRWSLNCYWRRDGEPIWRDPALIADDNRDRGAGGASLSPAIAQKFLQSLGERVCVRDGRSSVIPGDPPMGYRLPLDSQPWVRPSDYPYVHAPDPTQAYAPL